MKAPDFTGVHNADLGATRTRLTRAGSWKHQRIVVIVPAAETIPAKVYLSHCSLAFPPNNGIYRHLALGQEVGEAYSKAIEDVLSHPELSKWEYLLTMEHDNCPPGDGVLKLLEQMEAHPEFSVISGLYFTKGPGGVAQIWGSPSDVTLNFRPQLPEDGKLIECNGTGMGFALWRLSMFKDPKLRRPWFKTQKKDGLATQDLYFAADARKHGYRFAVDCSVKVGHYDHTGAFGPPDVMW
jgi:hypothetical protein